MKKILYFLTFGVFVCQAQINFNSADWSKVLTQAKSENKLIFLDAYATWCQPCKEMEEYVFTDLEVGKFYNESFVNVRMDMEEYPGVELAEDYDVSVYPTFLFINGDGNIVHRGCGAMDTSVFMELGEAALGEDNLMTYEKKYDQGDRSMDFMMEYLDLIESVCLDAEKFASNYLSSLKAEELMEETGWAVFSAYQWDIYSREFQYLIKNKSQFEQAVGMEEVNAKIYDTYLAQYQEVFESEELHDFGMRALMHSLKDASFIGADTLSLMVKVHYAEFTENWPVFAEHAIELVGMSELADPMELSELAWKFYLFIDNKNQLEIASGWARQAVDDLPEPSIIDTYASLQYKLGNKKQAVELAEKALEMAKELNENITHYDYQLKKFKGR